MLQCQSWVIVIDSIWPEKPKIFSIWFFTEKICCLLLYKCNHTRRSPLQTLARDQFPESHQEPWNEELVSTVGRFQDTGSWFLASFLAWFRFLLITAISVCPEPRRKELSSCVYIGGCMSLFPYSGSLVASGLNPPSVLLCFRKTWSTFFWNGGPWF